MSSTPCLSLFLLYLALLTAAGTCSSATWVLNKTYYSKSCPNFESIVLREVQAAQGRNPFVAAALLRLHFHDCMVNGCDSSILRNSTRSNTEMYALLNLTLRREAFDVINAIKKKVDAACGAVVSCADLLTAAARDAVVVTGGKRWQNEYGRLDGALSRKDVVSSWLPSGRSTVRKGAANASSLLTSFTNVGLNVVDLVALSGAHTLGVVHCSNLGDRMPKDLGGYYNSPLRRSFSSASQNDVEVFCEASCTDNGKCDLVKNPMLSATLRLDSSSVNFDNSYFRNMLKRSSVLTSDLALTYDRVTLRSVKLFAYDQKAFFQAFATSMIKMGRIQPSSLPAVAGGPSVPVYPNNVYTVKKGTCS